MSATPNEFGADCPGCPPRPPNRPPLPRSISIIRPSAAFTLIELLVVIGIIAVLAAMLLPALISARATSQGLRCLSNTKQLAVGWLLYANDHDDRLPPNRPDAYGKFPSWAVGFEDWSLSPNNTNLVNLRGSNAVLSRYLDGNPDVFKCPSDQYLSPDQKRAGWSRRLRSYSMNGQIGAVNNPEYDYPDYQRFMRLPDLAAMGPSKAFVFVDEHPDSINDSWFWVMMGSNAWCDLPGSYHNGGATFSFADGHAELKRWELGYSKQPVQFNTIFTRWQAEQPPSQLSDIRWVQDHTSIRK